MAHRAYNDAIDPQRRKQMTLTLEQAIQIAPSIGATVPAEHVSSEYRFMNTQRFLEAFLDSGWQIANVQQIRPRKKNPLFTKHVVKLQHPDFGFTNAELGDVRPQLSLTNSHDWSSRMLVNLALFRLACTNGMVVSVGSFQNLNVRHDADLNMTIGDITNRFKSEADGLVDTVHRWKGIEMSEYDRTRFATDAGRIRWGDEFTPTITPLDIARRASDVGTDLWSTFNRVQENLIRGGMNFHNNRSARAVRNIDADRTINLALWDLANDFSNRLN